MSRNEIPVLTIDGPSGAGKGTVAQIVARELGFHLLDSGAVYRAAAVHAADQGIDPSDQSAILASVKTLDFRFELPENVGLAVNTGVRVFFGQRDVTEDIRSEVAADTASRIAAIPSVRDALLATQRTFEQLPGLVADGRDMGTVIFPEATLKVFLTASAAERADRRYKQLNQKGIKATLAGLMQDIEARDLRDSTRKNAPLVAADDALTIDSTGIGIKQVTQTVLRAYAEKQKAALV